MAGQPTVIRIGREPRSGREQRRKSVTAQSRTPDLSKFYRYHLPSITPGEFEFDLDLLRPRQPPLSLNRLVDTFGWDDEQSVLTGSLTAYRPDPERPITLPVTRNQLVRCRVRWDGPTYELWTMRTAAPQIQVDTGNVQIDLTDDLAKLDTGKRDWWFRRTKHRKHGYTCDEIARVVCSELGVAAGELTKGTARVEIKMRNATGLAVLRAAYQKEKASAGRSFVIRMRQGSLQILPLARNPVAYVLADQIQTALIAQKKGGAQPVTVLTGRGHVGSGKRAKKVSYTAFDRQVVRALGYVPHTKDYGRVDSHADLRGQVTRDLAQGLRLNDTITISHAGIPFILRGDGVQIRLPAEGYSGQQGFAFCTRANHTVQAGVYTTDWDFTLNDPFLAQQRADQKASATKPLAGNQGLAGSGDWKTIIATYYSPGDSGGPPACGGDFTYNGGMLYAELGFDGGAGSKLGPLFGMAQLPCGFALEIRNPANGRTVTARKHDTGAGAPGASLDCWLVLANALGFTAIGKGPLQIRAAG